MSKATRNLKEVNSSPERRAKVLAGWADFLSRERWDCFATLTFRRPRGPERVLKDFRHWLFRWEAEEAVERGLARLDDEGEPHGAWINARRKGRAQPVYVVGIEPHKSGRLHAHALIRYSSKLPDMFRKRGTAVWQTKYGWATVEVPRSQGEVSEYVCKYVCKPEAELVLSESFSAADMPVDGSPAVAERATSRVPESAAECEVSAIRRA